MMKKILFFLFIFLILPKLLYADIKILVSIDNTIITNYDIQKESDYLELLSPSFSKLNDVQKQEIAKNSLINQVIKKKEIEKFANLETEKELLNSYLVNLYSNLGLNNEQDLKILLKKKRN